MSASSNRPRRSTAFLATILLVAACRKPASERTPVRAEHLVLVTIDTLRADRVGVYGGDVATPHLDRLASRGALIERASAHVPLTRPSHVSIFTGLLPNQTGVRENVAPAVVPQVPLLAEVLEAEGFRTAAFVSSVVLSSASGLDRGFEVYSDEFEAREDTAAFLQDAQRRGDETLAAAISWLEENAAEPRLFLWLHLYDPHDPYEPPEPYASLYPGRPYAAEVAWSDELFGRLEASLERLGLAEETLVVATSDHGEGLGEHGELLHGFFVYESTLAVPLLLRGPGVRPGLRLGQLTGLVDLFATLLDLVGVERPPGRSSSRSFAAALGGEPEGAPAPLYAESLVALLHFGWSDLRVARDGRWKYIQAPRPELYDLETDPGEIRNLLLEGRPPEARALRRSLEGFLDLEREAMASQTSAAVSEELLEQLGALGYLGGSEPAETATPGADPKDKIEEFRQANDLMRRGLRKLHAGDYVAAATLFEEVLAQGIESAELHLYLGRALSGQRRFGPAADHFERALDRTAAYSGAWLGLADAHAQSGDPGAAIEALRRGRRALPTEAALPREEARLLRLLRRPEEAKAAFAAVLELDPRDAFAHAGLGEALRDLGDIGAALDELERAVALEPEVASYWNSFGMTLGGVDRLPEAESAFRRAIGLDETNHRYPYNLGLALLRMGRSEEARPLFEKSLALEPAFEAPRERLRELTERR